MATIARSGGWKKRLAFWIGGICVSLAALIYTGISIFTADRLTRATNHPSRFDPRHWEPMAEAWSTRTVDSITLRRLVSTDARTAASDRAGARDVEFLAGDGRLGRDLHRQGFDVLLFDLRGHGESDPSRLYLGRRERADIRAVMNWANSAGLQPMTGSAGSAIRWGDRPC